MIRMAGIDMASLPEEEFDSPLGRLDRSGHDIRHDGRGDGSGAAHTVYEVLEGKPLPQTDFMPVRGLKGIKTAEVPVAGDDGPRRRGPWASKTRESSSTRWRRERALTISSR